MKILAGILVAITLVCIYRAMPDPGELPAYTCQMRHLNEMLEEQPELAEAARVSFDDGVITRNEYWELRRVSAYLKRQAEIEKFRRGVTPC